MQVALGKGVIPVEFRSSVEVVARNSELHEYTLGYQRPYPYPYPQGLSTLTKGTVLMRVWGVHPGQGGTRVQATDVSDYRSSAWHT